DARDPPWIGCHIFGIAAGCRAHDAVARLEILDVRSDGLDLARALEPDARSDAAGLAMHVSGRDAKVGPVEADGTHAHQHFMRSGLGFGDVTDFHNILGGNDGSFHSCSPYSFNSFFAVPPRTFALSASLSPT